LPAKFKEKTRKAFKSLVASETVGVQDASIREAAMTELTPDVAVHEDTIDELETGFGISFPGKVYEDHRTLGELVDDIWNELTPLASTGGRCPTAVSFYQVRRMILSQCPDQVLTPATRLADIDGFEYAKLQDALRGKGWSSPVRFPRSRIWARLVPFLLHAWLGIAVICILAIIIPICPFRLNGLPGVFVMIAVIVGSFFAIALLRERCLYRRGLPSCDTVGDLARDVARRNLRRLRAEGATGLNRAIVWRLLTHGTADRSAIYVWDFD
jgi:hypothetical protein